MTRANIHNLNPKPLDRYLIALSLAQRAIKENNVDPIAMIAIGEMMPTREAFETPSRDQWQVLKEERDSTRGITIATSTAPSTPKITNRPDMNPYEPY